MRIETEKWNEIVDITKAKIADWNAHAKEHGKSDAFFADVQETGRFSVLFTQHRHGSCVDGKAVAREIATGEVRATKLKKGKGGRVVGFVTRQPDPKSWHALADKPADVIVKQLKLTNFLMFISSSVTEATQVTI